MIRLMEFADRNLLTAPRVATSTRGSVAGSGNPSSAVSNASSGNNSSANIESLADTKSATTSAADSPAGPSDAKGSARDYKWLPKGSGGESAENTAITSSIGGDAKSEGKGGAEHKSSGGVSANGGQVLGKAEAAGSESVKGLDYGEVPDEPIGELFSLVYYLR